MKEIYRRVKAKTPLFFKKIQRLMMAISVASGLALPIKEELPGYLQNALPHLLTIGLVGALMAQLPEEKKKEDEM